MDPIVSKAIIFFFDRSKRFRREENEADGTQGPVSGPPAQILYSSLGGTALLHKNRKRSVSASA